VQVSGARVRERADREIHCARLGFSRSDRTARHRALGRVGLGDHLLILGMHEHRTREVCRLGERYRKLPGGHPVASVITERDRSGLETLAHVDEVIAVETAGQRRDLQDGYR